MPALGLTLAALLLGGPGSLAGRVLPRTFGPDHLSAVSDHDDPLVDAQPLVPGLLVQLTYATPQNLTRKALYPPDARCWLRRSVALALARAAHTLADASLRLVAWDCHRPRFAQEALYKAYPHPGRVSNPATGSYHQRGVAIDLSLAALDGSPVPLPTGHDEFNAKTPASAKLEDGPALRNRTLLQTALFNAGFRVNPKEWWHFSRLWGGRWPVSEQTP